MNIVLISTYELGRQPFGLASPAAWLRKGGHTVSSLDLSRQPLDEAAVREAALVAVYLPMQDRKSTRLNSSHSQISYAVFCLKKKTTQHMDKPRSHISQIH